MQEPRQGPDLVLQVDEGVPLDEEPGSADKKATWGGVLDLCCPAPSV